MIIYIESFIQIISALQYSKMQLYYSSLGALPKSFGWLTETGLLYAQVIMRNFNNVQNVIQY